MSFLNMKGIGYVVMRKLVAWMRRALVKPKWSRLVSPCDRKVRNPTKSLLARSCKDSSKCIRFTNH